MAGQELLNNCGKLWTESKGKRNEMHRMSDVMGLESYAHLSKPYISEQQPRLTSPRPASSTKSLTP